MSRTIEYVFSSISPWAYIGHELFLDIAKRHGAVVSYRPVDLVKLFGESGGLPFPERHPLRQKYTLVEMKRWRAFRGVKMKLQPTHWPYRSTMIDRMTIAAMAKGLGVEPFVFAIMKGAWTLDRDLTDIGVIQEIAKESGLPAEELLTQSNSDEIRQVYADNTAWAVECGCFGSPCYLLDGELFFGQDRLEMLEDALTSGREPIVI